jgi:hypothetical protein
VSVDMFEYRFRQEVRKLPPFEPNDERDPRVWRADFPAWRALFTSLCLFGHSTGYRLPSFEQFFRYCEQAYCLKHPQSERFALFFDNDLRAGMRQRISAWYEAGMAEAYLYACLSEAIEDRAKNGLVLYDPRADWKLKADIIAVVNDVPIRVSAFFGLSDDRPMVEARRDSVERWRKRNTTMSSHWGNGQLDRMPVLSISRTDRDQQVVNGLRLFSLRSVNALLSAVFAAVGTNGWYFEMPVRPEEKSS